MLRRRVLFSLCGLLFCCLMAAGTAQAQMSDTRARELSGSVYVRPIYVDNATGLADTDDTPQITEWQTEYGATLAAQWQRELSELDLNYEVAETLYHDESQADDSRWQGQSQLLLGNDSTFYGLDAQHSMRRILRAPGNAPILLASSIEREIFSLAPSLRGRLGSANQLALTYNHMEVRFEGDGSNDSTRSGVDLALTRSISPTHSAQVLLGERSVDFDLNDSLDYDMRFASLALLVENRHYDYRLVLGRAEVSPEENEDFSATIGEFHLSTTVLASNTVLLFVERSVSDSSQGNGNADFFNRDVSFDGSLASQGDQVLRTASGVSWLNNQLCGRCEFSISLGMDRIDYINAHQNDSRQGSADVAFAYQLSPLTSARLSSRRLSTEFTHPDAELVDTEGRIHQLELRYRPRRDLDWRFLAEHDTREANDEATRVITLSLALSYLF